MIEELANTNGLYRKYAVRKEKPDTTEEFVWYYKPDENDSRLPLSYKDVLEIFRVQCGDEYLDKPVCIDLFATPGRNVTSVEFYKAYDKEGNLKEGNVTFF